MNSEKNTYFKQHISFTRFFNPLNAELNFICHLLALVGVHHILHVSRIRVKIKHQKFTDHNVVNIFD
jgi:hypothetical protein